MDTIILFDKEDKKLKANQMKKKIVSDSIRGGRIDDDFFNVDPFFGNEDLYLDQVYEGEDFDMRSIATRKRCSSTSTI